MYSKQSQLNSHKQPKQKTCKACKNKFTPVNLSQITCDYRCAIDYAKAKEAQRTRKEKKIGRARLKEEDKAFHSKRARYYCHKYIRERDQGKPCISCGKPLAGTFHAGHFKTDGNHAILRYNEDNIHGQCIQCNLYKSGNVVEYEKNLRERIGNERVDALLNMCKEPKHYSIEELKEIQEIYKDKLKGLE